jgi:hypothetical protein
MSDKPKVYVKLPLKTDAIRGVYEICEDLPKKEKASFECTDDEIDYISYSLNRGIPPDAIAEHLSKSGSDYDKVMKCIEKVRKGEYATKRIKEKAEEMYGKYKVFVGTDGMTKIVVPNGRIFTLGKNVGEKEINDFIWHFENVPVYDTADKELTPKDFTTYQNKVGTPIAPDYYSKDKDKEQKVRLGFRGEPESSEVNPEKLEKSVILDEKGAEETLQHFWDFGPDNLKSKLLSVLNKSDMFLDYSWRELPSRMRDDLIRYIVRHGFSELGTKAQTKAGVDIPSGYRLITVYGLENISKLEGNEDMLNHPAVKDYDQQGDRAFIVVKDNYVSSFTRFLESIGIPKHQMTLSY